MDTTEMLLTIESMGTLESRALEVMSEMFGNETVQEAFDVGLRFAKEIGAVEEVWIVTGFGAVVGFGFGMVVAGITDQLEKRISMASPKGTGAGCSIVLYSTLAGGLAGFAAGSLLVK